MAEVLIVLKMVQFSARRLPASPLYANGGLDYCALGNDIEA